MRIFIIVLLGLIYFPGYAQSSFKTRMSGIGGFITDIRVGYHKKRRHQKGTVIFLHGYSDQMKNHLPLFDELAAQDLRVVSFDFPQHGGSTGKIWAWTLRDIADLVPRIIANTRVDRRKPIILAGFSTGGTIVTRMLQDWKDIMPRREYDIAGAILISPALPVNSDEVEASNYVMSASRITRGKLRYRPYPRSAENLFGNDIQNAGVDAYINNLKVRVPIVTYLAGENSDLYSDAYQAREWVERQRRNKKPAFGFQCAGAYHGLEFEPGIGLWVRQSIASMAAGMAYNTKYRRVSAVSSRMSNESPAPGCEEIY